MKRALLFTLALAACKPTPARTGPCATDDHPELTLRSPNGQIAVTLVPGDAPESKNLCNAEHQRVARLVSHGELWTLYDANGQLLLRLEKRSPGVWAGTRSTGGKFELRVGQEGTQVLPDETSPISPATDVERATIQYVASKSAG